jgi:flagellar hook protein FlgE
LSISSSMNAGVMGLNVNATRLSTISDNIANSSTAGYKRSDVDFSSLVLQQTGSAYAAGGVRVDTFKQVSETGSLITTGNSTDLAISGRGMLPVTNSAGVGALALDRDLMLVPTGSFTPDQNGNLRTQSGHFLMGWPMDTSGNIGAVSRTSAANLEPVNLSISQFDASPTTRIELGVNLPADATVAGATPDAYALPVEYYDNVGRAQNLNLVFTPTIPATGASNTWQLEIFDNAGDPTTPVSVLTLTFDDTPENGGRLGTVTTDAGAATYDPASGDVTLDLGHGPVSLFLGRQNDPAGLTQLSAPFSPTSVTRDGAPISELRSVEVDEQGVLQAVYDTGFRRQLYQIPVGDVPNLNGLEAMDGQAYAVSPSSGSLYFWDAGSGPVGDVEGFAMMESTTDIGAELTDLIETQRAYSSNAKIIQTVDEMLQETTNLKR